jgi:amidase
VWAEFVLARSVRDLAGVLDGVATRSARADVSFVEAMAGTAQSLRVGLLTRDVMAGLPVDAACVTAVQHAGRLLESLGHDVEESHPAALDERFVRVIDGRFQRPMEAFDVIGGVARYAQCRTLSEIAGHELTAEDVEEANLVTEAQVANTSGVGLADALMTFERLMAPIHDWWDEGWDVLVTPTLRQPAWPLGERGGALNAGVFPPPFSFTGQPAMSLPLFESATGLPVGVQLVAARGGDGLLLNLARQLEAAQPWSGRWPAIARS